MAVTTKYNQALDSLSSFVVPRPVVKTTFLGPLGKATDWGPTIHGGGGEKVLVGSFYQQPF